MSIKHTINTIDGEKEVELTPIKAIRLKCYDCCGFNYNEVKLCTATKCPLHPFRFGKVPGRKKRVLTDKQRESLLKNLAKGRAKNA